MTNDFYLRCKVKFFEKWVDDNGRRYFRKLVILIPDEGDERTRFLNRWLPETLEEHFELGVTIAPPIDSPCRVSVHRGPSEKSLYHHLFVMSKGVEDIILQYVKEGSYLNVTVLSEDNEEILDQAKDANGDYDLIHGQTSF